MFKIVNGGKLPTRGSKYSACIDLYANEDVTIGAGETSIIGLGVAIDQEWLANELPIPKNTMRKVMQGYKRNLAAIKISELNKFLKRHYIQLEPRSSLRAKGLIVGTGIIDLDYPDELKLIVHNPVSRFDSRGIACDFMNAGRYKKGGQYLINKGDKIAQAMLCEHKSYLFGIESKEERTGGIGSTDKETQCK